MWKRGDWKTFCAMLPEYAAKGHGEGFMHDTAMLLGALGWCDYDGRRRSSRPTSAPRAPARSTRCFPSRRSPARRSRRRSRPAPTATPRSRRGSEPGTTMPHLVILYTANLEAETDMTALCRTLADTHARGARRGRHAGLPDRRHARAGLPGGPLRGGRRLAATTPSAGSTCAWAAAAAKPRSRPRARRWPMRRSSTSRPCWRAAPWA